jgi:UDP-3-O-[3-hydroxymyristoyl] glucosamine N-acyltransferase
MGREIKPRVWVDDGAQLHRRARVVAPAYIGRASSVREDTLITRFSNVESFCEVDYGTAIEDDSAAIKLVSAKNSCEFPSCRTLSAFMPQN